jgi:hypothetical protein
MLRHDQLLLRILSALLAALSLGCAGPVEEVPLRPDDLIPPGADERKVPTILFESLGLEFTASNQGWARGFWTSDDWQATVNYVEAAAKANGYTETEVPLIQSVDASGITNEEYIRDYISPGVTIELVLINLDIMRKRGVEYDTSAKFLLLSGNSAELKASMKGPRTGAPPQ